MIGEGLVQSEKQKGFHRIIANYGRLLATMAMGIATVPLQVAWLGMEGFGLLGLVGSSVGLGRMLQDMMRSSMVRELGAAWHNRKEENFKSSYASAFLISIGVSLLTALFFLGIILIIPYLRIKAEWVAPAQWITACEGLATCIIVLASPAVNMLVVREFFFWHNLWTVVRRSSYLIATIIPFLILQEENIIAGLHLFGTIVFMVNAIITVLVVIAFASLDHKMMPTCKGSTRETMSKVAGTFGWNSGVVVAMNLHERIANFIMNLFFGLWGNAIFSLALRLVSYIRMATLGLTFGLDAVSARISSTKSSGSLKRIFRHSTRMHAFIAFPAMMIVFVFAEPLLRMWVGRSVSDPGTVLPQTEILVKIMVLGLACRAVSDGWMKLFYGAGFIHKYAPYVFTGGLFNPMLATLLIITLPKDINYTGAAIAYSFVFLIVHAFLMPKVSAQSVKMSFREILSPALKPLLIAFLIAPILFINEFPGRTGELNWLQVLLGVSCYGFVYVLMSWFVILDAEERRGIFKLLRRL